MPIATARRSRSRAGDALPMSVAVEGYMGHRLSRRRAGGSREDPEADEDACQRSSHRSCSRWIRSTGPVSEYQGGERETGHEEQEQAREAYDRDASTPKRLIVPIDSAEPEWV